MAELKFTGGARIGKRNISIPFAILTVSEEKLDLNASILGNLIFQPFDIISIEAYTKIPAIGQGVKISHTVSTYKERIIFWTTQDPNVVVKQIQETGFLNNKNQSNNEEIVKKQIKGGTPIKKSASTIMTLVWNIFIIYDIILYLYKGIPWGNGISVALGFMFLVSLLSLTSSGFRQLILKEGRGLNDIKRFAIFTMIVSGILFLSFRAAIHFLI